jgi:hypothetical protein
VQVSESFCCGKLCSKRDTIVSRRSIKLINSFESPSEERLAAKEI